MKKITSSLTLLVFLVFSFNYAYAKDAELVSTGLTVAFSAWGKSSFKGERNVGEASDKYFLSSTNLTGDYAATDREFVNQISDFDSQARIEIPANIELQTINLLAFNVKLTSNFRLAHRNCPS